MNLAILLCCLCSLVAADVNVASADASSAQQEDVAEANSGVGYGLQRRSYGYQPLNQDGYAIQEGYEGFLVPSIGKKPVALIIALTVIGILLLKLFKLPILLLKLKKLLKKPFGRQLDQKHFLALTRHIHAAIDRLNQLNKENDST